MEFEHIDPARRMWRYYRLRVEPSLLGGWTLVREWGRIGVSRRQRIQHCSSIEAAEAARARLVSSKLRRGYRQRN